MREKIRKREILERDKEGGGKLRKREGMRTGERGKWIRPQFSLSTEEEDFELDDGSGMSSLRRQLRKKIRSMQKREGEKRLMNAFLWMLLYTRGLKLKSMQGPNFEEK